MSLPKCFELLNTDYFAKLQLRIGGVRSADELQALINEVYADISLQESTITSQIALLAPILELLTAPTDLASALTWAGKLITALIDPIVLPYATLTAQLAALADQVADIEAAIEAVRSLKFPTISITIPEITIGCSL
jgi:hypothetical protein